MPPDSTISVSPLPAAVGRLNAKVAVGAALDTRGWSDVPLALRDRAFFSATVEDERWLSEAQRKLNGMLDMRREQVARGRAFITRDSFIKDMRDAAREQGIGTGAGDLRDVQSARRLGLIYDVQRAQAQGYARWRENNEPGILDAFPAQELLRVEARRHPRGEAFWRARWAAAGGPAPVNGRLVALKTDPVWTNISRFGTPWPPYDFGSGMGIRDISRQEAETLGIIKPEQRLNPPQEDFNARLQASVADLPQPALDRILAALGDKVMLKAGKLVWRALKGAA